MKNDVDLRPEVPSALNGVARQLSDAAKQELAAFRDSLQSQISALEGVLARTDQAELIDRLVQDFSKTAIKQTEAAVCQARDEAAEEVERQIRTIQDRAALEIEMMRTGGQVQLHRAEAVSAERASALADAQREAAAAREETQTLVTRLSEVRAQCRTLQEDLTRTAQTHQALEVRLDKELRGRTVLADSLKVARQEATTLEGELEACRRDLAVASERIGVLGEVRTMLEAEVEQQAVANQSRVETLALAPLARLEMALEKLGATASARGLLDVLIEHLALEFARAAIFAAGTGHFKVWRVRGVDKPNHGLAVPFDVDSPLNRALADQRPATLEPDAGTRAVGPFGSPVGRAIALPVVANGRVIAVAYAENPPEHPKEATDVGFKIAELLVSQVNRRFVGKRSEPAKAGAPDEDPRAAAAETEHRRFSPARRVSRIRMQVETGVLVDGATSVLVDLSTAGAQILCPSTVRPNHAVSVLLPGEQGTVTCKGRVVWAFLEKAQRSGDARYRAGVTFTEADIPAVEAFLLDKVVGATEIAN